MKSLRISRTGWLQRAVPAIATLGLLPGMALAGPAGLSRAAADVSARPGSSPAAAGVISTVAGGVGGPTWGRGIPIQFGKPCGLAYGAGYLYVADSNSVRKVDPRNDWLTTPAGIGAGPDSPLGLGGPANAAGLQGVCGSAVDHQGNLLIANPVLNRIEVVAARTGRFYGRAMTAHHIYSVAGTGTGGFSGDGGPATAADLDNPRGVTVDHAGNLVVADSGNTRIRIVAERAGTFYGQPMTAGDIYTVAGGGTSVAPPPGGLALKAQLRTASSVAVDAAGNLVIADRFLVRVVAVKTGHFYERNMKALHIYPVVGNGGWRFRNGLPANQSGATPEDVVIDHQGNLVIADRANELIEVLANSTGMFYGQPMTAGDVYAVAGNGHRGFSDPGGPALDAKLSFPEGAAVDPSGNVLIASAGDGRVEAVADSAGRFYGQQMAAGHIYTIVGARNPAVSGRPATAIQMNPGGIATDGGGNLVVADQSADRVYVKAASTGTFYGQPMTAGDIYTVAGTGIAGYSGDGGPATSAKLSAPTGVTVDSAGNLVIADGGNSRIRVVAESTRTFYGQPMTAGDIYTVAGDGTSGFSGDGGPATLAELAQPGKAALDAAGNLVIADGGNSRIRVVAESTRTFYGQPMTAGDIYTVAGDGTSGFSGDGGPATLAELDGSSSVAVDGAGNLVIADSGNNRIRVVASSSGTFYGQPMTAGDIYLVAGGGTHLGDGGPATSAMLVSPDGVVVDGAGNLVIADSGNSRIRVVAESTGTFYGQPMTAGDIYTVAGDGTQGFSGDGHPATSARLDDPMGVATGGAGGLLIADSGNGRVRQVTG